MLSLRPKHNTHTRLTALCMAADKTSAEQGRAASFAHCRRGLHMLEMGKMVHETRLPVTLFERENDTLALRANSFEPRPPGPTGVGEPHDR